MSELEGISDRAEYYETIGQTLAERAGIDPDRYGATYEDIGRQLITTGGGPLSVPAEQAYNELDEGIAKREIRGVVRSTYSAIMHGDTTITVL